MPSSISSSEHDANSRANLWASVLLVVIGLCQLGITDLLYRFFVPRISRIEGRTERELAGARLMRHGDPLPRSVLIVGNSLLGEGIQFEVLREALEPDFILQRFVVDNTRYYDWYYGLRRLHDDGSHPDVVVMMLTPEQLVSNSIRGRYFAYHLMRFTDVYRVARSTHLSNTQASDLFFARLSPIWGLGPEVRKVLLSRIMPDLPRLMVILTKRSEPQLPSNDIETILVHRLQNLRKQTEQQGSSLVLVLPPLLSEDILTEVAIKAGRVARVPILIPQPSGSLPASAYSDGYHLNDVGAAAFTNTFTKELRETLDH